MKFKWGFRDFLGLVGFLKIGGSLGAAIGRGLLQIGAPPRPVPRCGAPASPSCPDGAHRPALYLEHPPAWRQKIWSTSRCRCCSYNDAAAATGLLLQLVDRTGDIQARPAAGHIPQMARPVPGPLTYDAGTVQWDITLEDFQHLSIIWIQDM